MYENDYETSTHHFKNLVISYLSPNRHEIRKNQYNELKTYKLSIFSRKDIKLFNSDSNDGKIADIVALTCSLT